MYRQLVKYLLNSNISSTYPHNMVNFGLLAAESVGHISKFQRVSRFGFVNVPTSLNRSQPNFARCLAVSWAGTLYIHFLGLLPLTKFCHVQNSLCVPSLAFSYIGSVTVRHSSSGVSQTLWHGTRNGITELSQRAPHIFGWAAITLGIGPHSTLCLKKVSTFWLSVTLSNLNRFSKLLHCWKA